MEKSMSRLERADAVFGRGQNCSQSVLGAFAPELGLDPARALGVARAFGGGMSREGHVCGMITGALMAIGLMHDEVAERDEAAARAGAYQNGAEFLRKFRERNGEVTCLGLLGVALNTPEGQAAFKERGLSDSHCRKYLRDAIELLEEIA